MNSGLRAGFLWSQLMHTEWRGASLWFPISREVPGLSRTADSPCVVSTSGGISHISPHTEHACATFTRPRCPWVVLLLALLPNDPQPHIPAVSVWNKHLDTCITKIIFLIFYVRNLKINRSNSFLLHFDARNESLSKSIDLDTHLCRVPTSRPRPETHLQ